LSANDTLEVFVEQTPNQPPTVESLIGPSEVNVGQSVQFGVLANDDGPNEELQYQWNFDNGNSGVGATSTNTYTAEGTYTVQVNITDGEGEQTSTNQVVQVGDGESAGGNDSGNANLSITVQDATNQQPISAATVSLDNQDTETSPDTGDTTGANGELSLEVPQSNYVVTVSAGGYQDATESLRLQGDDNLTVSMQPEQMDSGGEENNSTGDNPDQPGFTLLLGALVLIVAGAFVYYRREIKGPSHPLK
jgi:PKD repeat protein